MFSFNRGMLGLLALVALGTAAPALANPFDGGTGTIPCGDGQVVYSPIQLWPPNHEMRTVSVNYMDNDKDSNETVSLTIDSIDDNQTQDDNAGGNGCGKPANKQGPDWTGVGNSVSGQDPSPIGTMVQVRAERCAKDGARVYTITVTCGDPDSDTTSNPTTVPLTVTVPHDRHHAQKVN